MKVAFIAVGTVHHYVDGIVPRVFKELERRNEIRNVYYCNGKNIKDIVEIDEELQSKGYEVIAVDVSFFTSKDKRMIKTKDCIRPGSGINKKSYPIGTMGLVINISDMYKNKKMRNELFLKNVITPRIVRLTKKKERRLYNAVVTLYKDYRRC